MKKAAKTILSFLIVFIITVTLAEIFSPVIFSGISNLDYDKREIANRLKGTASAIDSSDFSESSFASFIENKALHPYLGFVIDTSKALSERADYYGFSGTEGILQDQDETIKIVISGGSVAYELAEDYQERIIERLEESQKFKGKKIRIFNLAMGGYKQPQQLMALNYFLSLGARFDIWVNLDGFNEITLPIAENHREKVAFSYPRLWNIYARKSLTRHEIDKILQIAQTRQSRAKLASLLNGSIFKSSSFFLTSWALYDQKLVNKEYKLNKELYDIPPSENHPYQTSGPFSTTSSWQETQKKSIALWKRTSSLMANICYIEGIDFFHFLQPNQYLKGSKQLTEEEKLIAYESGSFDYKFLVETGYPILIDEGHKILEQGAYPFIDLTMMFRSEDRSVYADKCCHFNEMGYNLIAERISEAILSRPKHSKNF